MHEPATQKEVKGAHKGSEECVEINVVQGRSGNREDSAWELRLGLHQDAQPCARPAQPGPAKFGPAQ